MSRHVRKGDIVQVMSGKFKAQQGRIVEVITGRQRVRVEGIALVKRHLGKNKDPKNPAGGIVEKLGSIHISNVMPLDPADGKPTRVAHMVLDGGQKVRIARRSGQPLKAAE